MSGNGHGALISTVSFGPVSRKALIGDLIGSVNTGATVEQVGASGGMVWHDIWTGVNFNFVTTVASVNASVTLTGNPRYYIIVYNPSTTATVYVNLNAAAVLPVAAVTAGSFPLLASSFFSIGFAVTTVQVISVTASIDVHITSFA